MSRWTVTKKLKQIFDLIEDRLGGEKEQKRVPAKRFERIKFEGGLAD